MKKLLILLFLITGITCFHPHVIIAQDFQWHLVLDSSQYGAQYAYSPVIINKSGVYYVFACSIGTLGGWDNVRLTKSLDGGITWQPPQIVLKANASNGQDMAACDPGITFFQGYYYLYYSSAYNTGNWYQTVVQVARSTNIEGPYYTYTQRGTWENTPQDPKKIILPHVLRTQGYGAGTQRVITHNNLIYMWYLDDSTDLSINHTYLVTSSDAVNFSSPVEVNVPNINFDFKYDPTRNKLFMLGIPLAVAHRQEAYAVSSFSADGIHWDTNQVAIPSGNLPDFTNTIAISSDEYGHLNTNNRFLFVVSTPWDLASIDTWGKWDLYGSFGPLNNNSPIGWLDSADCSQFKGWAGDRDSPDSQINVKFYYDSVDQSHLIGTTVANVERSSAVCDALGSTQSPCLHGFIFNTPSLLKDNKQHNIYAMGENIGTTGSNTQLSGNPRVITCWASVDVLNLRQLLQNFTNIFDYNRLVGNYGQHN